MNICMCGVEDSYPHREDCPYPYFGHDVEEMKRWFSAQVIHIQKIIDKEKEENNGKSNFTIE